MLKIMFSFIKITKIGDSFEAQTSEIISDLSLRSETIICNRTPPQMTFRNYITGTIFLALLIWGPIDDSWPSWLLIRISYLILIPLVVWLLFGWIWNRWQPDNNLETTLSRILSGVISAGLFILAIREAISSSHIGNTQTIRTRDGYEDIGDYIELPGPAYGNAFIILIVAMLVLWFGVLKRESKVSD